MAQSLRFAPLPMFKSELIMKEYRGILEHLEKELDIKIETVYYSNYRALVEAIRTSKVDIAHLGPLPFAALLQKTQRVQPIVQFLNKKGKSTYTCSLIALQASNPTSLSLPKEPMALTQPLSTCGYLSAAYFYNKKNLVLKDSNYYYANTHSNVVLEVLLGQAKSGIVKSSEFLDYKHLGLLELAKSPEFPGFLWVGSPEFDPILVTKIQKILTKISFHNPQYKELTSTWGEGVKYGSIHTNALAYEPILQLLEELKIEDLL